MSQDMINPQYLALAESGMNTRELAAHYREKLTGTGFADQEVNQWLRRQEDMLYLFNTQRMDSGQAPLGVPPREVSAWQAVKEGFAGSTTGLRMQLAGARRDDAEPAPFTGMKFWEELTPEDTSATAVNFGAPLTDEEAKALPWYKRLLRDAAGVAGDMPDMAAGAMMAAGTVGAASGPVAPATAPLAGMMGAFGAASGVKAALAQQLKQRSQAEQRGDLMQALEDGDMAAYEMLRESLTDLWGIAHETTKGMAIGAAAYAGGLAGKALGETVGIVASQRALGHAVAGSAEPAAVLQSLGAVGAGRAAGHLGGEIAGLMAGTGIVEGRIPDIDEWTGAASLILGMRVIGAAPRLGQRALQGYNDAYTAVVPKLRAIYKDTGITPREVVAAAKAEPSIVGDLLSDNVRVPEQFKGKQTITKADLDNLVEAFEKGANQDIVFGTLPKDYRKALNEIRAEEGEGLIRGDNLVIPANVVSKLIEKRMLRDGMNANQLAQLLLDIFHSGDADFASSTRYPHIQAIVKMRGELADLGFIGINPSTGETVIKSVYSETKERLGQRLGEKPLRGDARTPPSRSESEQTLGSPDKSQDGRGSLDDSLTIGVAEADTNLRHANEGVNQASSASRSEANAGAGITSQTVPSGNVIRMPSGSSGEPRSNSGAMSGLAATSSGLGSDIQISPDAATVAQRARSVNEARHIVGRESALLHTEGERPVRYEVWEAADLVPSHDALRHFAKNDAYPEGVQERAYHTDVHEQGKVRTNALRLDPRFLVNSNPDAINGPPIITSDGIVLGGNSRAMSLQMAYEMGAERSAVYRTYLEKEAPFFGIPSESIAQMERPVLVRVAAGERAPGDMARESRLYNQAAMQGLNSMAEGVSKARLISNDTMQLIAKGVEEFGSLAELLSKRRSRAVMDALLRDGVLEATQLSKLTSKTGLLNASGRALVENTIRGKIVENFDILDATAPSLLNKLDKLLPELAALQLKGGAWDLRATITDALDALIKADAAGQKLGIWLNQGDLFGQGSEAISPRARILAEHFAQTRPTWLKARVAAFGRLSRMEMGELAQGRVTPDAAFHEAFTQPLHLRDGEYVPFFNPRENAAHAAIQAVQKAGSAEKALAAARKSGDTELTKAVAALAGVKIEVIPVQKDAGGLHYSIGTFELPFGSREHAQKPISLSDTIAALAKAVDVPVRVGKLGALSRAVRGLYKERSEVIRTRVANDIGTVAHEIGHHLEKALSGKVDGKAWRDFAYELDAIATSPRAGGSYTAEGFAEFLRYYITQPEVANQVAPRFFAYFEDTIAQQAPEAFAALRAAQEQVQAYLKQPAVSEILSHISFGGNEPGFFSSLWRMSTNAEARSDALAALRNNAVRHIVDRFDPLRRVVDELAQGRDLLVREDPYKLARLYQGVAGKANAFLEYAPFHFGTLDSVQGVRALKSILTDAQKDGDSLAQFSTYLVARRALELGERGIRPGVRIGTARAVVAELAPRYEALGKELVAYQDALVQYLVDSGVVDAVAAGNMRALNQHYVPFQRVMQEYGLHAQKDAHGSMGTSKGFAASNPIKRIKGSGRDIIDPLESILQNTYTMIEMAERNAVGSALVHLARKGEGTGWLIEEIPQPKQAAQVSARQILDRIKDVEPVLFDAIKDFAGDLDGVVTLFTPSTFIDKKNQIAVLEGGKRRVFQVAPEIAEIMNNLGAEQSHWLIRFLGVPARTLRAGAVLSPDFMIRNTIRDMMEAAVKSDSGFVPVVDSARGIASGFRRDAKYWEWAKAGGDMASLVHMDRTTLTKTLKDMEVSGVGDKVWNVVASPLESLRLLTELSEAGTRLGEFGKAVDKLQSQGLSRADALREAALRSRDVSIDFARMGTAMRAINQIIPFSNAAVQSLWRTWEVFKERPAQTALKAAAYITIPSIMIEMWNYGDPDIAELPAWQRDMYWCFKVPGGDTIWRIPKPFEIGVVLGSVPQRVTRHMLDVATDKYGSYENAREAAFRELSGTLWDTFMLRTTPTLAAPLVEAYANKSLFTDRPISPADREGMLPEYQYTPYTTQLMRKLSALLGSVPAVGQMNTFSPAIAEQFVRDWTGGLGMYALQAADFAFRKAGVLPDPMRPANTLADIPVVRAFVARNPSMGAESINQWGKNWGEAQKYLRTIVGLQKEMRFEDIEPYLPYQAYKSLEGPQNALNNIRKMQRMIWQSPVGTPDEKRQMLETLTYQAIQVAKQGNAAFELLKETLETRAQEARKARELR